MNGSQEGKVKSDALVLFGVTGDLAYKKIFPALQALAKMGLLDLPVIGVPLDASSFYEKAKINFILKRTKEAVNSLKAAFLIDPGYKNEFEKEYPDIKSSKLFKKILGEF